MNGESSILYIDDIGKILLSTINDINPENNKNSKMSVKFEAFSSKEEEMKTFISQAAYPNTIRIHSAFINRDIEFVLK